MGRLELVLGERLGLVLDSAVPGDLLRRLKEELHLEPRPAAPRRRCLAGTGPELSVHCVVASVLPAAARPRAQKPQPVLWPLHVPGGRARLRAGRGTLTVRSISMRARRSFQTGKVP